MENPDPSIESIETSSRLYDNREDVSLSFFRRAKNRKRHPGGLHRRMADAAGLIALRFRRA